MVSGRLWDLLFGTLLKRLNLIAISTAGFCGPATNFDFERQGRTAVIHTDVRVICAVCPNLVEKSIFGHL